MSTKRQDEFKFPEKVVEYPSTERQRDTEHERLSPRVQPYLGSMLLRMLIGVVIWSALGALALLSAIPYGGGSPLLMLLLVVSVPVVAAWMLWPMERAIREFNSRHKPQGSDDA